MLPQATLNTLRHIRLIYTKYVQADRVTRIHTLKSNRKNRKLHTHTTGVPWRVLYNIAPDISSDSHT